MTAFSNTIPPERLRRIQADQVQALYEGISVGLMAALGAGIVLYGFLIFHGQVAVWAMTAWLAAMVLQTGARLFLIRAYHRVGPPPEKRRPWLLAFTLGAFIGGLTWGIGSLVMVTPAEFDIQLLVVIVICAIIYGSLSGFGSYLPFYAFLFPSLLPIAVWSALQHDARHIAFAVLALVWLPVVAWLGRKHDRNVLRSLNLRYENIDLLEDLRVQKERAEQASISKSRFLASASHDLRQPVHALGMFVGALKGHEMGAPARRLLGHIESSIGALDGLFTSLLDISRLDAGVIAVNAASFPIQSILDRCCRDLAAEAQAKGIALRLVECSALVESDPILLERIVRNMISNAVRYTQNGRVLVGCRRGDRLRVQVWDTGPGIPAQHREKVFEEFFQLSNSGRDRSQGLGLGLAIVRRLTRLLDIPLRLHSVEGKGTLFELALPAGSADRIAPLLPPVMKPPVRGLVLVIDDESAICEAMRSLLESWGHEVITALSGGEMLARAADVTTPPSLIISDYRLQNGENGIGVIRRLQSEFNEELPALLITGDTAPDRLAEARASGFLLLHKPLSAERLQQAMHEVMSA